LQQLECAPDKSLFFDDRPQNVEAARRVGIEAHVFESAGQARAIVERGQGRPEEDLASEK
jgi:FMN phosphatase YigB (HAD superfamily)